MDLSKLTVEELQALLAKVQEEGKGAKQAANLDRARREAQQQMMGERGGGENFLAGIGKSIYDAGRGLSQLLPGGMTREQVDEAKRLDAPLMESGGGIAGNLTGQVAQSLLPLGAARLAAAVPGRIGAAVNALPGSNTMLGGGALGGAMGFIQPVGTEDSRFANTALGTFAGGAIPAGVAGYRATRAALDPLTVAGRDRVTGRMLNQFATDPADAAAKLAAGKSNIPGVMPSVGEATLDPGLATLERSMLNFPGPMQGAMTDRLAANNAARQKFLEALGGTADDLTQARAARGAAFEKGKAALQAIDADIPTSRTVNLIDRLLQSPMAENDLMRNTLSGFRQKFFEPYPAAERLSGAAQTIRDAVDRAHKRGLNVKDVTALEEARRVLLGTVRRLGKVDEARHGELVDAALEQVSALGARTKGAQSAIDEAVTLLAADNVAFKRDPARLMEIYKEINRVRGGLKADGADISTLKALDAVKRSLGNAIDKGTREEARAAGVGTFKDVNRAYRQASKEMEGMQILQSVKNRASGVPEGAVDSGGNPLLGERQLYAGRFLQATDPANEVATVRAAIGGARPGSFERYLTDTQKHGVGALRADTARALEATKRGKPQGSPTAQFLYAQNLLGQTLGPLGLPTSLADRLIGAATSAPIIGAPLAAANRLAGRNMAQHVSEVMMDPQRAAMLMGAAQQAQMRALNPGVSRLLPPTLAGMATGMFGARQPPEQDSPYGARW